MSLSGIGVYKMSCNIFYSSAWSVYFKNYKPWKIT